MVNQKHIGVVGSSNMDIIMRLERLPKRGETVSAYAQTLSPGGKGANRAVSTARMGGNPMFFCCLGDDAYGSQLLSIYNKEEMDTSHVSILKGCPTGNAHIFLEDNSSNSIVIFSGANASFTIEKADDIIKSLDRLSLLSIELEIPAQTVERVIAHAVKNDVPVIVDTAPASSDTELSIFKGSYILSPNETEAETLTGIHIENEADAKEACSALYDIGVKYVIIKLGKNGSICFDGNDYIKCPPFTMAGKVVDTTAAGDCYMGALCACIYHGMDIESAMRKASVAAGIAVTRLGAIPSLPKLYEVDDYMNKYPYFSNM